MQEDVYLEIDKFIEIVNKMNIALEAVGFAARVDVVTFYPKIATINGLRSRDLVEHLVSVEKISDWRQVFENGKNSKRAYIFEYKIR